MNSRTRYNSHEFQRQLYSLFQLNVSSFVELAVISPKFWQDFSDPAARRRVAVLLDWPAVCPADAFEQMALTDFVAIFLNSGVRTIE